MHGGVTGMVQAIKVDPEHGTDIVYIMTDLEQTEITVRRDQVGTTHAHHHRIALGRQSEV